MEEDKSYPIKYMSLGTPLMGCFTDVSKEFIIIFYLSLN